MLDETRLELFDRHRVGSIILNRDPQLCPLMRKDASLVTSTGDDFMQVQARGEDPVIRVWGSSTAGRRSEMTPLSSILSVPPPGSSTASRSPPVREAPALPAAGWPPWRCRQLHPCGLLPIQLLDHHQG